MAFIESNSVEHYILHQLTGVNLNAAGAKEPEVRYGTQWQYQSAATLVSLITKSVPPVCTKSVPPVNHNLSRTKFGILCTVWTYTPQSRPYSA